MGKRDTEQQPDLFITHDRLPRSPGHVCYRQLNQLLAAGGFDPLDRRPRRAALQPRAGPPVGAAGGVLRMLLVGFFEGINSQRGSAWRCSDSLSLRDFLGIPLGEESPDHSSLSYIRNRLPHGLHEAVFVWVLKLAPEKKLL